MIYTNQNVKGPVKLLDNKNDFVCIAITYHVQKGSLNIGST